MRIVAVLNQKGGVGKTTTTVNLGAALALRGRRVLLIDADPQGNLTDHLGIDAADADQTLYDVLVDGSALDGATMDSGTERLSVVPAEPDLAAAESELASELGRESRLRKAIRALAPDAYDWVLIDCPPSLGLLSLNAMVAANELLIALQTEYFALKGLEQLDRVLEQVREHVNPDLRLLGILPTLVNPVTLLTKDVIDEVEAHYGNVVLGSRIRRNVSLAEAPSQGMHIFRYKPNSPGADDYLRLADELEGARDTRVRSRARSDALADRRRAPEVATSEQATPETSPADAEAASPEPTPAPTPAVRIAGDAPSSPIPPAARDEATAAPTPPPDRPVVAPTPAVAVPVTPANGNGNGNGSGNGSTSTGDRPTDTSPATDA